MANTQMTHREWADLLPHTVFEINNAGTITFANEEAFNTFGYTRDDFNRGLQALDMFVPEDRGKVADGIRRTLNGETLGSLEFTVLRKDGTCFPSLVKSAAIIEAGQPVGLIGSVVDISERKQPDKSLHLIQKAVEGSNEAIGMSDSQGNHFYQNPSFTELFGYTVEELNAAGGGPAVYADQKIVRDVLNTIMAGKSWAGETEMISKDGRRFPVSLRADAVKDDTGEIIGLIGIHSDITERKQAEQALRDSEERFRTVFENANDEIILVGIDGTIIDVNKDIIRGRSENDLIGKRFAELDIFTPAKLRQVHELFQRAVSEGKTVGVVELEAIGKDGNTVNLEVRPNLVRKEGQIQGAVAILSDITERKRDERKLQEQHNAIQTYAYELEAVNEELLNAQEKLIESNKELQNSEKRYRDLANLLPQTVFEADLEGNCTYANHYALESLGFTQEDIDKGLNALELFIPEDKERAVDSIVRLNREMFKGQGFTVVRNDGSAMSVVLYTDLIIHDNKPVGIRGVALDITERKRAEEALQESEEKYRLVVDNIPSSIQMYDRDGTILFMNAVGAGYLDGTPEDFVGKSLNDVLPDQNLFLQRFRQVIDSGLGHEFEDLAELVSGRLWFKSNVQPIRDASGKVYAVQVISEDITERKQAEEELSRYREHLEDLVAERTAELTRVNEDLQNEIGERKQAEAALKESEEKFRTIFEEASDEIIFLNEHGIVMDINERIIELWGYTPEEVIGRDFRELGVISPENLEEIKGKFQQALQDGNAPTLTVVTGQRKGGGIVNVELSGSVIQLGGQTAIVAIARDITDRKRAEEALRESETKFRTIFEEASDEMIFVDEYGTILDINKRTEAVWGRTREEVVGKNFLDFGFVLSDSMDDIANIFDSGTMENGKASILTRVRGFRKDGGIFYSEVSGRVIELGGRKAVVVIARDITERMQAEQALRESEEKFNKTFRLNPNVISITSVNDGRFVDVNESFAKACGWTREEIIGKAALELGLLKYPEDTEMITRRLQEDGEVRNLELTSQDKLGNHIFGLFSAGIINIGGEPYILSVTNDITERRRAEEALRASEERFRSIIENAEDAITLVNAEGIIVYVSPSLERIAGYKPKELIGASFQDYMHPEDFSGVGIKLAKITGIPGAAESIVMRLRRKDGSWCWVEGVCKNFLEDSNVQAVVCNYRDVTQRIQVEEILRVADERWRALADNSPVNILSITRDGTIQFINRPLTDHTVEEVIGTNCYDYISPEGKESAKQFIEEVFRTGRWRRNETAMTLSGGYKAWYEITAIPIMRHEEVVEVIYVANDITERKHSEEQLRQYAVELQQANTELSEYAEVVVHDIGTPLRAIRYHTRILRGLTADTSTDEQQTCIETIDTAASECEELAQNLMGLSQLGRSELHIESVDVGILLQKIIASSGASTDVDIRMDKEWPKINSDSVLLGHIFRNLIDNAIKFSDASSAKVELTWKKHGKSSYEFSVRDNGIGIDPEHHEAIFQVFRRLHHPDEYKGTGVGLAIVKKAVAKLGGSVRVESKPGQGSTFKVIIPKSKGRHKTQPKRI